MNRSDLSSRGRSAIAHFHNASLSYSSYRLTFDELIGRLGSLTQQQVHLEEIGAFIFDNEMSEADVQEAMESMASRGQGMVPPEKSSTAYFNALGGKLGEINWVDGAKFVAVETGKELASGFQQVGDTILTTLKSFGAIGPIAVVAAVLYIGWKRTKRIAGE